MSDRFSFVVRDGDVEITLNDQKLLNVKSVSIEMASGDAAARVTLEVNTRYMSVVTDKAEMEIKEDG